jgi:hypothetical protein
MDGLVRVTVIFDHIIACVFQVEGDFVAADGRFGADRKRADKGALERAFIFDRYLNVDAPLEIKESGGVVVGRAVPLKFPGMVDARFIDEELVAVDGDSHVRGRR